ncbi:MAG: DNA-packaging protein [Proteobacteria bacterium]|nr:DNA-packaging protein [Pseudomonadota bacterium]
MKSLTLQQKCQQILEQRHYQKEQYNWLKKARLSQIPPEGEWTIWLILAGRGFGKTRTGAETIRLWVQKGVSKRIALIGKSLSDVMSVMVEGESGLLNIYPPFQRPKLFSSKRQLMWPNGAIAHFYGADHFEQLRGPQFDTAWMDEVCKFRYPQETLDQLLLGLRLGNNPKCIITTTPKPLPFLDKLLKDPKVVVTKGTTYENKANLAKGFLEKITHHFEGTRLGAQELYGQILSEKQGALWRRDLIFYKEPPLSDDETYELKRIVIAIDPATTHHEGSDETGIIVAGLSEEEEAYILEDLSGRFSPVEWGRRVVNAYFKYKADRVIAEVNKGGDLVERVVRSFDSSLSFKAVRATRGKATRAEPIAALYEQKKVFHTKPLPLLESQLCDYIPGITSKSPDRLDALVWALTELLLESEKTPTLKVWGIE